MASSSAAAQSCPDCDHPNNLRIVLLGKNVSENSRVGNIILATTAFHSEAPSSYSQQHSQIISGTVEKRQITVINTAHLLQPHLSHYQLTQRVRECVSQSDPGPHVILLVLQNNDFSEEDLRRVKTVLNLFSVKAIKHTIVLTTDEETRTFMITSRLWNTPMGSNIKWAPMTINNIITNLTKECGGGHLKFDARNAGWRSEMIRRIEEMLKEEHEEFLVCNIDEDGGSSADGGLRRSGGSFRGDGKKEDGKLKQNSKTASDGGVTTSGKAKLNIVLCGYNTTLKTSVSKILRGKPSKPPKEMSNVCVKKEEKIHGRQITVIELPALTRLSEEEVMRETLRCVSLCDPGVHAFVLVTPVDSLTNEDRAEMEKIKIIFNSSEHFMVLFITELTVNKSVSDFVASTGSQSIVSLYGNWYSVMGLKDDRNSGQILNMLDCIDSLKTEPYSLQMYMRAPEKRVRDELEENLRMRDKEIKDLQEKIKTLVPEGVKLNLVLCGSDGLKSFISNLILKQGDRRPELSSECVRRDVELHGRLVSLVELPALLNTRLSEEEVMRQTLRCVSLCDPGVHVFILTIPDAPLNNEDRAEMENIQKIFSSRINKHIMILIYQNSEEKTAELNEETQSVIKSFGGRHHFIGPDTQVSVLMEKLVQMVEANNGVCFSKETLLDAQMEKLLKFEEMKKRIHSLQTWFHSKDSRESEDEVRIVLLGKTGVGKSATGNTILGRDEFTAVTAHESVTKECQRETCEIGVRHVTVIDTPGVFDTELTNEEIQREISHCIPMILPGPHVFIIVLSLTQRFTQEEATSVKIIQQTFGENSLMYTMVLFTGGDRLKDKTIEEFLGKPGSPLMNLIDACGNRVHVFNNSQTEDRTQVSDLLKKIDDMVKENGDSYYSCKMFREMEREKREEEYREREEQYKRDIKEREEREREMQEEMKTEREEWEKQKQQERRMREEDNERWRKKELAMWDEYIQREERYKTEMKRERQEWERQKQEENVRRKKIDQETWDEYYQKLKQEIDRRHAEREVLQSKHEEEKRRIKMMMEEERQYIEDHEREIREEMKREREEWEKQQEKQRRDEEENKTNRFNQLCMGAPEGQDTNIDEDSTSDPECLRILLFGRTGNGKSSTGNTILGNNEFCSKDSKHLVTTLGVGEVDGKSVAVVDTPGLFDTSLSKEQVQEEMMKCISLSAPGPHVFIIVLSLGEITQEEKETLDVIKMIFGPKAADFSIVLFTKGDALKKQTIEQYVEKTKNDDLKKLISDCGNRFLAFNNRETQDRTQVTELLNMIEEVKKSNEGRYFTNEMFQEAAISIENRREMLEENKRKNQDQVEELEARYDLDIKRMRQRLEEKKRKIDEERERLENKFREKEETLRREFEEKEKSDQKKREEEDWERSEEEEQQRTEYDHRIDEMERKIKKQRLLYEKQLKESDKEKKKREEEYKQDQERLKTEQEHSMAELRRKQEDEIKKRDLEEQMRKEQEEKEREEWKRKIKKAEDDKISTKIQEEIKRQQREWEKEKKKQMREREEEERKSKERHQEQLREKQEELEKIRKRFETERKEERQNSEEEKQKLRKEKTLIEREYEKEINEMKSHYEQLEQNRKEEWDRRKQEDEERRSGKRKRWEKMIEDLKQELEVEIRRRQEKVCDEMNRKIEQLNDSRKRRDQFKEKLEQLYEVKRLRKELKEKWCLVM
ncbi:uncharacterized protein LOC143735698 [Siphateles boraxobius]|uniref:uncharacterized protein LOC143735698 n=1 Tax=Siphateles boraxobius TaxID=180520 RepID=UPI004064C119